MTGLGFVVTQAPWALDRLLGISDRSFEPPPHLVPEDPKPAEAAAGDWAFDSYAARSRVQVWDGPRVLDHEASLGHRHLES